MTAAVAAAPGGRLDQRWSDRFAGFMLAIQSNGTITVPVIDRAALHGPLRRVGDLGVTLISVNDPHEENEQ
ncbi:hypothetical protein E3O19_13175 [Cryobacterium algoritolerans]|uniref:Uncharacterized protein n=1 Tax=Cryobacterium algoritolerans TaxID=1259184 RepID=A0A4R8WP83_9MICO|nr:hypothetical protein E3O19_13175 [Cryobacterium algoritolerans]